MTEQLVQLRPINRPHIHGYTATIGDRSAELVRLREGVWRLFLAIGGHPVHADPEEVATMHQAAQKARAFLASCEPVAARKGPTDIGR